ncbi:ferritin-like domain-containing protein [Halorussus salilacus]|uniref:ferritin-like domain-containing protein n=1 Tax=Halorussus salilacus TaxID=2953750 RepID=UPI00209F8067|nr:ferritin-like domain-containing protein [Halorussus salilacus]USZ68873.1 ferritin-like domain-containing protein [Halorussus salilacus]
MSVGHRVSTDNQLVRLLQIAVVLEEVVEVRAARHYETLSPEEREADIEDLLSEAREESADHRERLEALIDRLDAEAVPLEEVEQLVEAQYAQTAPEDFDGVLYDQLHGEETAYKFYDDLIEAIEASDATFGLDREELLATLREIREEEAEGVEEVTAVMEDRE